MSSSLTPAAAFWQEFKLTQASTVGSNPVWLALVAQIDAQVASVGPTIADTNKFLQFVLALPLPAHLAATDSDEYDAFASKVIGGLQAVATSQKGANVFPVFEMPPVLVEDVISIEAVDSATPVKEESETGSEAAIVGTAVVGSVTTDGTFPEQTGRDFTGRTIYMLGENITEESVDLFCGPEVAGGYLADNDTKSVRALLAQLFADHTFDLGAAENYHILYPNPGESAEVLVALIRDRLEKAGAVEAAD